MKDIQSEEEKLAYQKGYRDGLKKSHEQVEAWVQMQVEFSQKLHDFIDRDEEFSIELLKIIKDYDKWRISLGRKTGNYPDFTFIGFVNWLEDNQ